MLSSELQETSSGVLSQLPEQTALAGTHSEESATSPENLLPNPTSLADLDQIPDRFQKTYLGEQFLLYLEFRRNQKTMHMVRWNGKRVQRRNRKRDDRVIVLATRRNIELLYNSPVWFLDGTFKTSPSIFTRDGTIDSHK